MTRIAKTGLSPGDELACVPVKGGLFFTIEDPEQARMLAAGLADMEEHPEIYQELAK